MIPLSSLVTLDRLPDADIINRFNVYAAAKFLADPAPGYTTGQAKAAMEASASSTLETRNASIGWTGEAYQLGAAAGTGVTAFGLGLVMVF